MDNEVNNIYKQDENIQYGIEEIKNIDNAEQLISQLTGGKCIDDISLEGLNEIKQTLIEREEESKKILTENYKEAEIYKVYQEN